MHRRDVLTGAAVLGVGLPLLAACGDDTGSDAGTSTATDSATPSASSSSPSASESGTPSESASAEVDGLVATSDVPVGGGTILQDEKVVVTQPTKGDFKCFSAVCTHQGCLVSSVSDGTINCTCHGSTFSVEDGSVVTGPATSALGAVQVEVASGQVVRG